MARQRRTLDEQIAELTLRGRSERAQIMSTPEMAPVGPDMIEDEAIQSGHVSNGAIGDIHIQDNAILNQHLGENAVAMENLDETLKGTLASLAENEAVLATAGERLDAADERLSNLFEEVEVAIPKAITDQASKALEDAKTHATNAANTAKTDAITDAEAFTITKMNAVANSKNATFYGTAVPTASAPKGSLAGDTYRRRDSKGNIIGEYEWDGSKWTQRKMTSESMTAVDVGVLTAGSAVIDDAVARTIAAGTADIQKANIKNLVVTDGANLGDAVARRIAANTGEFIELSTDQLKAGTANIDTGVVNKLYSDVVESRKMKASQVLIGEPGNLFPDPNFLDPEGWPSKGVNIVPNGGRNGNNGYQVPASATQAGGYYGNTDRDRQFAVVPGATYYVSAWVKPDADVVAKQCSIYLKWTNPSTAVGGNFATPSTVGNDKPIKAGVWTEVSGLMKVPAEATRGFIGLYVQSASNVRAVWSEPSVERASDSALLVNGAVTADKLEANLVLTNRVIAGDPAGVRAEMSPEGFKVFGKASGDKTSTGTYEIVRLGVADTNDMFAIADKEGITQASISETGIMSGKELYISDEINFKGDQLSEVLWSLPKGHVASAFRYNNSAYNAKAGGEWAPYLRIDVEVERNRLYRISTSPVRYGQDAGGTASLAITQATGSIAQTTSVMIDKVDVYDGHDGNSVILSELAQLGGAVKDTSKSDKVLASWLLMFRSDKGQFGIRASAVSPVRLLIEDVGPLRNTSPGVHLDTTSTNGVAPTPPPSKVTYTKDWACNWIKSFDGSGNFYNYNTSKGYQGLSPAGYGNMKTVMRFPDITGTVSGSVIHKVEVYLYFEHWYYNAGGTARIGLSGSTAPSTYGGGTVVATSGGWPKPGGRWVTIPTNYYTGFQNGSYRGITLEGDGTYNTYGIAHPGTLRVTYTK